mgnify:CR=1 FL=1
MQAQAILKNASISPQKVRLVADQVRGLSAEQAMDILQFSTRKGAQLLKKVLHSAISNAEHNLGADVDELYVSRVMIDQGPTMKRFMARARGRGDRILKRSSHITVVVADNQSEK